ncbi:MAG: hypothetical protein ACKOBZ_04340 [Nitrospira sp.]
MRALPALEDLEAGKPVGAVVPMSPKVQRLLRDKIEIIEYLLNREEIPLN